MKATLTGMSVMTVAAGIWLAVMENLLKHSGYGERMAVAACIAAQGVATLLLLRRSDSLMLRVLVLTGSLCLAVFGASAIARILTAPHFEGFVLLISSALIVQCVLVLFFVLKPRPH